MDGRAVVLKSLLMTAHSQSIKPGKNKEFQIEVAKPWFIVI